MCEYCDSKIGRDNKRGKELTSIKKDDYSMKAYMWGDNLEIDTSIDDFFGSIKINYCPKCGRKLRGK